MKTVNHVSAHLSTMCPVHTLRQRKVSCRRATPANKPMQRAHRRSKVDGSRIGINDATRAG